MWSGERIDELQLHVVAVRDQLDPRVASGAVDRRLDEPEVAAGVVGHDEEPVALIVDVVLDVLPPRLDDAESVDPDDASVTHASLVVMLPEPT